MRKKYHNAVLEGDRNLYNFISDYIREKFPSHKTEISDSGLLLRLRSNDVSRTALFLESFLRIVVPKFLREYNLPKTELKASFADINKISCVYQI